MKNMKLFILFFTIFITSKACSSKTVTNTPEVIESSQKLYFNAKIFTVDSDKPWAEALLIDKNKIIFVGSNIAAKKAADENVIKIDLKGKVVDGKDDKVAAVFYAFALGREYDEETVNLCD
ncbi:hypothetical protein [uncultured Paraglaciecola sp.]|uniref:hypothetical protein n=1 Tax=uncultured Paraglaciecola sp. TaxID=1765024 RepID=UPI002623E59F|nr:hypothetical protein [uncultured Paraglaciecola sp.]